MMSSGRFKGSARRVGFLPAFAAIALWSCSDTPRAADPTQDDISASDTESTADLRDADVDVAGLDGNADIWTPVFVAISFAIDDRANQSYGPEDGLAWIGAFTYDPNANVIVSPDPNWAGPHPRLWDDGPMSTGGHEPEEAAAGDHLWSVVVYHEVPTDDVVYRYAAARGVDGGFFDFGLIWTGPLGRLTVPANSQVDIELEPFIVAPFGYVDYRITIDGWALNPAFLDVPPAMVTLRSSLWGWCPLLATDDASQDEVAGDGVFSFTASANFGPSCTSEAFRFRDDTGLALPKSRIQFVPEIGGVGYAGPPFGRLYTDGISAEVRPVDSETGSPLADWTSIDVYVTGNDNPILWGFFWTVIEFTVPPMDELLN